MEKLFLGFVSSSHGEVNILILKWRYKTITELPNAREKLALDKVDKAFFLGQQTLQSSFRT